MLYLGCHKRLPVPFIDCLLEDGMPVSLRTPLAKARGVLSGASTLLLFLPGEEKQLLCGFAPTFGQTRSGSGDTKALGQVLPRIRAFFGSLVCCPQARLRTFPANDILGTRGDGLYWVQIGG